MAQDDGTPTPEERADVVVLKLERFIRDNRTLSQGVSFRKWQDMARVEILKALYDAEADHAHETHVVDRALMLLGIGLSTVGVWGTALAVSMAPDRVIAAVIMLLGGLAVLWAIGLLGLRTPFKRFQAATRRARLERVRSLSREISDIEYLLKKRKKSVERERDLLEG